LSKTIAYRPRSKRVSSEATPSKARLVVSHGETSGRIFELLRGKNLVGRWDPEQGCFPEVDLENHDPDTKVSRRHALIERNDDLITIEDLGSLNGTYVNRASRLAAGVQCPLKHGDEIIVGKTFLRLEVE